MNRRRLLVAPFALLLVRPVRADVSPEMIALASRLAGALSDGDPDEFLKQFDPAMPDYGKLRDEITALLAMAGVISSVKPLSDEGDAGARTLEVDWSLQLVSKDGADRIEQRHGRVTFHAVRSKHGWKFNSVTPMEFFAPPRFPGD